jgi:hypothetical protein
MPDLRIEIRDVPADDVKHRFRNFGEAVYRVFREPYVVSLNEIDASTTQFHVREVRRRSLRAVTKAIHRIAAEHNFEVSVAVLEGKPRHSSSQGA